MNYRTFNELKASVQSESTRRRNPELFAVGAIQGQKPQPDQRPALEPRKAGAPSRGRRVGGGQGPVLRVALISVRHRLCDSDNVQAGLKPLRDCIARECGLDDEDRTIAWEYGQHETRGEEGTIVRIEVLTTE